MTDRIRSGNAMKMKGKRKSARRGRYWSAAVTQKSDALDIEGGAFALDAPRLIAESLKRSAERSRRRKAGPYQSAMSMLNVFINRAGRNLPAGRKRVLAQAKIELRRAFGRLETLLRLGGTESRFAIGGRGRATAIPVLNHRS